MPLSDVEQAFAEDLILMGAASGPQVSYLLALKASDDRPLWELAHTLQLAPPDVLEEAQAIADSAVKAAGPQAFSFSEGAMIGPWELLERRGRAPGGELWLGSREGQKALLRLVPPGSGMDDGRRARFVERSNVGQDPPDPAILRIDEADEDFGWLYTATRGFEGRALAALRERGPLGEANALLLAQGVARTLALVHGFGVVHGGLGPLGVLVHERQVLLSDFGVGSAVLDGPVHGSRPGERLGLLLCAAPELVQGDASRGLDARDDLYALGALLYQAVTGVSPGDRRAAPDAPWLVEPRVSPGLREVLARLLAPEVARYGSADALLADLARVSQGQPPAPLGGEAREVRGRRADGAGPQQLLRPEVLYRALGPATPGPLVTVSPARAPAPAPVEVEAEPIADDLDEPPSATPSATPRSVPRKPRSTQRGRALEGEAGPRQSAGWLLLLTTIVLVVGGLGAAHALTEPQGADAARAALARIYLGARDDHADYGELQAELRALSRTLGGDADLLREYVTLCHEVDRAALAARARLLPAGGEATAAEQEALAALLGRVRGTRAQPLIDQDLGRLAGLKDGGIWRELAQRLLAAGFPAEAAAAADAGDDRALREAAARAAEMVFVPGGATVVVAADGKPTLESPPPCYLGRTEVTRAAYAAFLADAGAAAAERRPEGWDPVAPGDPELPATGLDLADAQAYAAARGLELPDAATLARAARGPLGLEAPWGAGEAAPGLANYGKLLGGPVPVGSLPGAAAPCGAVDLLGNVAEWCAPAEGAPPAVFGGHWATGAKALRSEAGPPPGAGEAGDVGFRVMLRVGG